MGIGISKCLAGNPHLHILSMFTGFHINSPENATSLNSLAYLDLFHYLVI